MTLLRMSAVWGTHSWHRWRRSRNYLPQW